MKAKQLLIACMVAMLGCDIAARAASVVASDDFEPDIDRSQWSTMPYGARATNYGGSVSGSNSLWLGGRANGGLAGLRPVDTSLGGRIEFFLRLSDGEDREHWYHVHLPEEAVALEYSIDGGINWTNLATYDNYAYTDWTRQTLAIPAAAQTPATQFRWRQLSAYGGNFALDDVAVTVGDAAPVIVRQPMYQVTCPGGTAIFTVEALALPAPSFQWRFNGLDLPGQTNASLVLARVGTNQAGAYSVVVSNALGEAVSADASLFILEQGTTLADDFESGLGEPFWQSFGGAPIATNHGGSVSGTHALWFGGDGSRFATLGPLDTSIGGWIQFYLRVGDDSSQFWDDPEMPEDGIVFEYSVDGGGNWARVGNYRSALIYEKWTREMLPIPAGALATNTLFRWRQLQNSGTWCDHWALDDVSITLGPMLPLIPAQPASLVVSVGGTARYAVEAAGMGPFSYHWQFNGLDLPGETNASLLLSNVTLNQAGAYRAIVSNPAGSTASSNALLRVIELLGEAFHIATLTTNGETRVDPQADGHWGGIAVSGTHVFYSGATGTIRFARDLSGRVSLGGVYAALANDCQRGIVFSLGNGLTPLTSEGGTLTTLLEIDGQTGLLTGRRIDLSMPIELGARFGIFSGYGRIVLSYGDLYDIALPSGTVTPLGTLSLTGRDQTHTHANWGVAEFWDGMVSLVYGKDDRRIVRTRVPDGATQVLWSSSEPTGIPVITAAPALNRWYSCWGWGGDTIRFAEASFNYPASAPTQPLIYFQPQSRNVDAGDTVNMGVVAFGDTPLSYQWWFEGNVLADATNASLALSEINLAQAGSYTVTVSNALGTVTSAPAILSLLRYPPALAVQPQDRSVTAGHPAAFTAWPTGTPPFFYQWQFNGTNLPGATNPTLAFPAIAPEQAGGYAAVIWNDLGSVTSSVAQLTVLPPYAGPGSLDLNFDVTGGGEWVGIAGSFGEIASMALQSDGQILIAGSFVGVSQWNRRGIARLNPDGSLDTGFVVGWGADGPVAAVALQSDGKVLIGGAFTHVAGQPRRALGRLLANGSLDPGFYPDMGATGRVHRLLLQPNGRIVIAGSFGTVNGVARPGLARLHADGSLDGAFKPHVLGNCSVEAIALQPDGKILAGGEFGNPARPLVRLQPDGTLDAEFDLAVRTFLRNSTDRVSAIAVQSDGGIYLGGLFHTYLGSAGCARLYSDGRLDTNFNTGTGLNNRTHAILGQPDGKVIFAGDFDSANNAPRPGLVRFNPDGSLDAGFDPSSAAGPGATVNTAVLDPNGQILVAGNFKPFGVGSQQIICLQPDGSLNADFKVSVNTPGVITSAAVQINGGIVVGGRFTGIGDFPQAALARLDFDGFPDSSFRPVFGNGYNAPEIYAVAIQSDEKIVISGAFNSVEGNWRPGIAQLNPDGSLDYGFSPGSFSATFSTLEVQSDGKILLGGWLYNTSPRSPIITRLNSTGGRDFGFNAVSFTYDSENGGEITALALQSDGKVVIGGRFFAVNGTGRPGIARLYSYGSLDFSFFPNWSPDYWDIYALRYEPDGDLLVGGHFLIGEQMPCLRRFNAYGSLDSRFQPVIAGTSGNPPFVASVAIERGGKMLIAGTFDTVGGVPRQGIARLDPDGRLDTSFVPDFRGVESLRLLLLPETGQVLVWGIWENIEGMPFAGIVRLNGGDLPPAIITQPLSRVCELGQRATFGVNVFGTAPLNYQWRFNGADIPGATNSMLTFLEVTRTNAGVYSVFVGNGAGTTLSSNATLVVRVPQRLLAPVRLADGSLRLESQPIDGGPVVPEDAAAFEVLASTNLIQWITLTNPLQLLNGSLRLNDPESTNFPARFYRLLQR